MTLLPDETEALLSFSFTIPNSCRSNSENTQYTLRAHNYWPDGHKWPNMVNMAIPPLQTPAVAMPTTTRHNVYFWLSVLPHSTTIDHPAKCYNGQMQIPHQTTQCTLRAHSKNTRIGQMAINGQIWPKWPFMAIGSRATNRRDWPSPKSQIAPPAGEKIIK